MDYNGTLFENSRRLRFEAFSNLAIELNKSNEFEEICSILVTYIKFIVESFVFTVNYRNGDEYLHILVFRGEYFLSEEPANIYYDFFVKEYGEKNVPVSLTREQIAGYGGLKETLYGHEKVKSACIIPCFETATQSITVGAASKSMEHYNSADFRFIKLISETLSSKISQVFAQRNLAQKTTELAVKNQEVTLLYQNLEEIVKERTRELTEANDELQTLFYRTSHDFRAPLTNIIGLVNIAEITDGKEDKEWVLQNCRAAINHLDRMLNKLNTLSRMHTPQVENTINFNNLVSTAKKKCLSEAPDRSVTVTFNNQLTAELRGNASPFLFILENLFENAIQYGKEKVNISVTANNTFNNLTITVTDDGTGIKPEIMHRVFDMYFRGDARSTGSGLGLYVVNKIIKMLDASIRIDSNVNEFTRVTMSFPVKAREKYLQTGLLNPLAVRTVPRGLYGLIGNSAAV
ncbi:MAG TPA: HAMP domain-containing sensor histidine kinase [Chitinophagaceae bacterium]|nr:HAMP domain-containing sensor histidine kinase [Chitinophagaceae bacterium]